MIVMIIDLPLSSLAPCLFLSNSFFLSFRFSFHILLNVRPSIHIHIEYHVN